MRRLRPIEHEDRLSVVEHLDELRSRLIFCAVAFGVARLADRATDRSLQRLTSVAAVVVFLSLLPDLGWGVAGRLRAAHYPDEWSTVRELVESEPGQGSTFYFTLPRAENVETG